MATSISKAEKMTMRSTFARLACRVCEPVIQEHSAGGVQHGIRGSKVVAASLGDEEKCEGDEVHPGQHAKAAAIFEEEIVEAGEREGKCEKGEFDLVGEKAGGLAFADVAFMDEAQKIKRDEMMPGLPKEIGEEKENGDGNAPARAICCAGSGAHR